MKAPAKIFEVTDYDPRFLGPRPVGRFTIVEGDKAKMKKAVRGEDNIDSYVASIAEDYLRSRYHHVIGISFPTDLISISHNLIRDCRSETEGCITSIIDEYTNRYPDILIVNSVVRDIWSHGGQESFIARDEYQPMFERLGFIDTYGGKKYNGNFLPFLIMAYVPNMGGNGVISNMKTWW